MSSPPKKVPQATRQNKRVKNETRPKQKAILRQLKAIALMTPFLLTSWRSHTCTPLICFCHDGICWTFFFSSSCAPFYSHSCNNPFGSAVSSNENEFFFLLSPFHSHCALKPAGCKKWKIELCGMKIELKFFCSIKLNLNRVLFLVLWKTGERNCIVCLAEKFFFV